MRGIRLLCVLVVTSVSASCARKPDAPERDTPAATVEGPAGAPAAEAEPDVDVGDVVDYAIGKTQIDAKKRMESRIKSIQVDRNRQIEEALGE